MIRIWPTGYILSTKPSIDKPESATVSPVVPLQVTTFPFTLVVIFLTWASLVTLLSPTSVLVKVTAPVLPATEETLSSLSTLSHVVPFDTIQSPTLQEVIPSIFVVPATDTL